MLFLFWEAKPVRVQTIAPVAALRCFCYSFCFLNEFVALLKYFTAHGTRSGVGFVKLAPSRESHTPFCAYYGEGGESLRGQYRYTPCHALKVGVFFTSTGKRGQGHHELVCITLPSVYLQSIYHILVLYFIQNSKESDHKPEYISYSHSSCLSYRKY